MLFFTQNKVITKSHSLYLSERLTFCNFFHYFRSDKSAIMKKGFFSVILILISCKEKKSETYFTPEKASRYFKDIEAICKRDSGKLWGQNLFGPIMFVERVTRRIVANQPDNENLLKLKDGIYTGLYPKELILTNAPVKFGGTQFAMTPLPTAEEDEYRIKTRAVHSLFHRFQENEGDQVFILQCKQYG